jgi:nitroimidazol reductase NimA-like FMN-containing flavoprotein (pyridoxamine 5'-phosphate oxidase superfamily)
MSDLVVTERTKVRRRAARGRYDRDTVYAILDEGLVAHVGFAVDGQPFVIPVVYGRAGDRLLLHGSVASRMLRTLRDGFPVCVTVTIVDGIVLARSVFHHSMNYRSVVVLGRAVEISDMDAKVEALRAIVDHVAPERWGVARTPTAEELRATTVLELPVSEASAKVRTGPPLDDEGDLQRPCWAGEIPLRLTALTPIADPALAPGIALPASVASYRR